MKFTVTTSICVIYLFPNLLVTLLGTSTRLASLTLNPIVGKGIEGSQERLDGVGSLVDVKINVNIRQVDEVFSNAGDNLSINSLAVSALCLVWAFVTIIFLMFLSLAHMGKPHFESTIISSFDFRYI